MDKHVPNEKIFDTEIIRVTFREIVHGCVALALLTVLLHAAVFFSSGDSNWKWCVLIALCHLFLFPMTGPEPSFGVFLAATLTLLISTLVYVVQMTKHVGSEGGFAYLLLVMFPVVMVAGRVDMIFKWAMSFLLLVCILVLDVGSMHAVSLDPYSHARIDIFHMVNIGVVAFALSLGSYKYFSLTSSYQSVVRQQASTDPLTGLLNRRRMMEMGEKHLAKARRFHTPLAIIMGDVDFFKAVNDAHGHDAGDLVLCRIADLTLEVLREYDSACRWGGEEFLLVLPEADADHAVVIAERIRQLVNDTAIQLSSRKIGITMTFGVAALAPEETFAQCINRADAALYAGKSNGRNQVSLATGTNQVQSVGLST